MLALHYLLTLGQLQTPFECSDMKSLYREHGCCTPSTATDPLQTCPHLRVPLTCDQGRATWESACCGESTSDVCAPPTVYDVLIIGSGYGGIGAARKLAEEDPTLKVGILERSHTRYTQFAADNPSVEVYTTPSLGKPIRAEGAEQYPIPYNGDVAGVSVGGLGSLNGLVWSVGDEPIKDYDQSMRPYLESLRSLGEKADEGPQASLFETLNQTMQSTWAGRYQLEQEYTFSDSSDGIFRRKNYDDLIPESVTLITNTDIASLQMAGSRVSGVVSSEGTVFTASHVIVSGGVLGSIPLLQKAGIGDAATLTRIGVQPRVCNENFGTSWTQLGMLTAAWIQNVSLGSSSRTAGDSANVYSSDHGLQSYVSTYDAFAFITNALGLALPPGSLTGVLMFTPIFEASKNVSTMSVRANVDGGTNPELTFYPNELTDEKLVAIYEFIEMQLEMVSKIESDIGFAPSPPGEGSLDQFVASQFGMTDGSPYMIQRLNMGEVFPTGHQRKYFDLRLNFTLEKFRDFLLHPDDGVWGTTLWHNHGGAHVSLDGAQRVHTFCNMYVGDASAATQPFLANTGALAMALGQSAADSVLAAIHQTPEIYTDGSTTYHVDEAQMHVIKDTKYVWSVPIKSRTSTAIVFDIAVTGTVDGVETTVQYSQARTESGAFTWDSPPSTTSGTLDHPTGSLPNTCE